MWTSALERGWRCRGSAVCCASMSRKGYGMVRQRYRLSMTPERSALARTLLAQSVMRPFLVVLCLITITACDENPVGPTVGVNERFTLAPGDVATVRDLGLNVQ